MKIKKICLLFSAALCLITSCNTDNNNYRYSHKKRPSPLERASQKYSANRKISPTESAKLGLNNRRYILNNGLDLNFQESEYGSSDNFVNDDGSYVGQYKVGNSYQVNNVTYHPQQYDNFEEVGKASWYGDDFHGKKTANGEIYYKGDLTAAHPTLPLPSIVRITNLSNGKSLKVRVNDRGPFAKNRIVDVSEKAAEALGFRDTGTAMVKLEFLKEDTDELLNQLNIK